MNSSAPSGVVILERVLQVGIALLPLVVLCVAQRAPGEGLSPFPPILYGDVAWKGFVFRIAVEVLFGLWVVLAWIEPRARPRFSWILAALSVFVVVMALADLLGPAPRRSLWGNFERMQGWVGLVHLYAFFLVGASVMNERAWRWFFHVSLATCALVAGHAVLEGCGALDAADWRGEVRTGGLYGGLGGPVFLGVYLLIHVFVAAFYWLRARTADARWAYAVIGALLLVALVLTGTRAAWLGLVVGGAFGGLLIARRADARVRRSVYIAACGAGMAVVAVLGVAWLWPTALADVPVLQRVGTMAGRADLMWAVWAAALEGAFERPLLGWGQENFTYVFDRHYSGVVFQRARGWMWNDQPHNVWLKWLVEGGVVGLLAYASIWIATAHQLWRRTTGALSHADRSIVTGMIVGYLVYDCAQLDDVVSYVLVFAVLAAIHSASTLRTAGAGRRPPALTLAVVGPLVAVAVGFAVDRINLRYIRAGRTMQTVAQHPQRIWDVVAADGMIATEARERFLNIALYWWERPDTDEALRAQLADLAMEQIEPQLAAEPERARTLFLTGWFLIRVGQPQRALAYLGRAHELAPSRPRIVHQIARAYQELGDLDAALAQQRRARSLFPSERLDWFFARAVVVLAHKYADRGQADRGVAIIEEALALDAFRFPKFGRREAEEMRRR